MICCLQNVHLRYIAPPVTSRYGDAPLHVPLWPVHTELRCSAIPEIRPHCWNLEERVLMGVNSGVLWGWKSCTHAYVKLPLHSSTILLHCYGVFKAFSLLSLQALADHATLRVHSSRLQCDVIRSFYVLAVFITLVPSSLCAVHHDLMIFISTINCSSFL